MTGFGLSLLLFLLGGWMVVLGLRVVRYEHRQLTLQGLKPEPFYTITAKIGFAILYLGLLNLFLVGLDPDPGAFGAIIVIAGFSGFVLLSLFLGWFTFWLVERYLPHLVT
jgi:hypothetical protein